MRYRSVVVSALLLAAGLGAGLAQTPSATSSTTVSSPARTPVADASVFADPHEAQTDFLATNLISRTLYGPGDEKLGKILNLVLDPQGRTIAVVVGVGGFLGIGEKNVAIAFTAMKQVTVEGAPQWYVGVTKAQLKAAPRFVPFKN